MFLNNAWYVAGWSSDLAAGESLSRRYLDQPVVVFRTAAGRHAALEDRCTHRSVPLSQGHVTGEVIRCAYHGLEYSRDGICTKIPSQDRIPPKPRVRGYPIHEQDAAIWIWMGEKISENSCVYSPLVPKRTSATAAMGQNCLGACRIGH